MKYKYASLFAETCRKEGKKIVFTNGCFDILHAGHLRYLKEAKELGDILIVGINSDHSVRRLKGSTRPVIPEAERLELLEGMKPVDRVFLFHEDTPYELIQAVIPDILVKGGDWPVESIVGYDIVMNNGGEVKSLSFYQGKSTTNIVAKIAEMIKSDAGEEI